MGKRSYEIDMCHGSLLPKILQFSFPLMLSGVLQLLFNAADIIVVGRYSGKEALAAVGSTSALINLIINIFLGLSIGTNVLVARYIGAKEEQNISEAIHTSILTSLVSGTALIFLGGFLAEPLLTLMGTPDDVLSQAALYMRIYFLSMPAVMLYNFGSAILRAVGDTKRPLFFLTIAGCVNVVCNLFFVIVLHWGVAGVATATAISQLISAVLVLLCLVREPGIYRVQWKKLRIHWGKLREMIRIGLPAGLQGSIFSISNVLIQSSVNSFGSVAMAGNTAASNIEGFIWTSMNAFYQANLSFTSQNMGARKYSRLNRIAGISVGSVAILGLCMGVGSTVFAQTLLGIYNSDPEVIAFGVRRMHFVALFSCIGGVMDVMVGSMRGLGYSVLPTVVALTGACAFRVVWIFTVFAHDPTPETLFFSYPVSWVLTGLAHITCFLIARRKLPKQDEGLPEAQ